MAKASSTSASAYPGAPKDGDRDGEFRFNGKAAQKALDFFALLRHVEGEWAGKPFVLDRWQKAFIWCLFGWLRSDGTRRYRKAYLEIPRKNTKSTLGAGITLKLLLADDEAGAQIYGAAENRDQAGVIYRIAAAMVYASPQLAALAKANKIQVVPSTKTIAVPGTNSFYRAISSEAPSAHGINAHGIVFDELHTQPNDELYSVLSTSQGARRQPLTVMMTTAGFDMKSLCGREHDYAKKVLSGVINDPTYLAVIYGADPEDDILSPETWKKANPAWDMLGPTFQTFMAEQAKRAHDMPSFENTFKRLHLNIWTKQDVRWMPLRAWDACGGIVVPAELKGRTCIAGLDLASVTDLAALILVFPPIKDETKAQVLCYFFVPEDNIEKRSRVDGVPYREWADNGFITATPGDAIDYSAIELLITGRNADGEKVREGLQDQFWIKEVVYDRWGAYQLSQRLAGHGINMRPIGQGWRDMSGPTKETMRMVLAGEMNHGGNPVLRWCADNVVVMQDPAGNLKPAKDKSKEKIDGIVALIMAIDGLMRDRAEGDPGVSFIA